MPEPRCWVAVVAEDRYAAERLYAHDIVVVRAQLPRPDHGPQAGEPVVLVAAADPPMLFGLGRIIAIRAGQTTVGYTHRCFDEPVPLDGAYPPGLSELTPTQFAQLSARVGAAARHIDADRAEWLVSLALPIEAPTPAEAVRRFWTYLEELGPRELPAFVWPRGNELAMQAYVLGDATDLDPEQESEPPRS